MRCAIMPSLLPALSLLELVLGGMAPSRWHKRPFRASFACRMSVRRRSVRRSSILTAADSPRRPRRLVDSSSKRVAPSASSPAEVVLVNQRGLQFVPRVQAIAVGRTVRFTNQDGETHNVHVVSPGFAFNQSMAPGQFQDFTPAQPGVMRLACDIHHAHEGLSWSSARPPGRRVCDREGRYRLDGVPTAATS